MHCSTTFALGVRLAELLEFLFRSGVRSERAGQAMRARQALRPSRWRCDGEKGAGRILRSPDLEEKVEQQQGKMSKFCWLVFCARGHARGTPGGFSR